MTNNSYKNRLYNPVVNYKSSRARLDLDTRASQLVFAAGNFLVLTTGGDWSVISNGSGGTMTVGDYPWLIMAGNCKHRIHIGHS